MTGADDGDHTRCYGLNRIYDIGILYDLYCQPVDVGMGRHYDLVIFDMDGVLTRDRSSWTFIHDMMGVSNEHNLKAFIDGKIDEDEFIRSDIDLWKNKKPDINIRDIAKMFRELRLIDGIQETVACLHYNRIKCVICSGGIDLAAKMIADEYGFDDYAAVTLLTDENGILTGEGRKGVDLSDKGVSTRAFIEKFDTTKERTVSIGNSFTDIKMFESTGMSIAFNPEKDGTAEAADHVIVSKNIADVLDFIIPNEEER